MASIEELFQQVTMATSEQLADQAFYDDLYGQIRNAVVHPAKQALQADALELLHTRRRLATLNQQR